MRVNEVFCLLIGNTVAFWEQKEGGFRKWFGAFYVCEYILCVCVCSLWLLLAVSVKQREREERERECQLFHFTVGAQ